MLRTQRNLAFLALALLPLACSSEPEMETPEWLYEETGDAPHEPALAEAVEPEVDDDSAVSEARRQAGFVGIIGPNVVEDARRTPRWDLHPGRPWTVTLGRGSGRSGLDTVQVNHEGAATVVTWRREERRNVRATVELDRDALRRAVGVLAPTELKHRYREPGVMDGTQWVFRISQGDEEHVVYCDNRMPDRLDAFATRLDELLAEAHLSDAAVIPLPSVRELEESHDASLWDAVRALPPGKPID